jgi:hypothetical protein
MSSLTCFDKIFDFNDAPAKKLTNSSYLEELAGLLKKVALQVKQKTDHYFFENDFFVTHSSQPNSDYNKFIEEFKNTFLHGSGDNIHIIRGYSGIGKTLFFEKGIKMLTFNEAKCKGKYIKLGVDFKNIDQKEKISYYEKFIHNKLWESAVDAIRDFGLKTVYPEFNKKYDEFCGGRRYVASNECATSNEYLYPIMYFCKEIYSKYKRPCVIVFDNIDLSCVETQKNVFKATANICNSLGDFMSRQDCGEYYRVFFAMRPETFYRSGDINTGNIINFPLPNILKITLEIVKEILLGESKKFDEKKTLKFSVTLRSIINDKEIEINSFSDIASYFIKILEHYLLNLWQSGVIERLGKSEEFHCNIVNYNIRKFLTFFSDTLYNGGFKPLTKEFNEKQNNYTVFDYIEMIIRGKWPVHPGNKYIDGEGGNGTPIIFNLFDSSLWNNNRPDKIKHFMLYIRILQYLGFRTREENISYSDLKEKLSIFYDLEHIKKAIQELIFVRIIYSSFEGDDNVASKNNYSEVTIEDNVKLYLAENGKFYINKMIYEFEYLYQMALSSIMPEDYVKELKSSNRYIFEKEQTVLYFLKGIFEILRINLDEYNNKGNLDNFKKIFCQDSAICRPYRKMLKNFISVMNNKVQAAGAIRINKFNKLKKILDDAQELEQKANDHLFPK